MQKELKELASLKDAKKNMDAKKLYKQFYNEWLLSINTQS